MKSKIYNKQGTESGSIDFPSQFQETINQDLIKRAVLSIQASKTQKYGAKPDAGIRSSAKLSKRRRKYRGSYGIGISRVPRKIMWKRGTQFGWEGSFIPGTKGGRRAHPPKAEKDLSLKVNKKERRKAIRSALSASIQKDFVKVRHQVPENYPLVITTDVESLTKTKEVIELLSKLGLERELSRISKKKIRAGKGKRRGRKYKIKRGPLLVVSKECPLLKAANNLQGVDIKLVENLNTEDLAPGTVPGRLTIWSQDSIERIDKERLFTNFIVKESVEEKPVKKKSTVKIIDKPKEKKE